LDRPRQVDDEVAFRPNRRFLRPVAGGTGRSRRVGRLAARYWKAIAFVALLTGVIVLGYLGRTDLQRLQRLRYFQVTDLVVEGNRQVPTATIVNSLGLSPRVGILEVDLQALSERIVRNPWIKTAHVSRRLPVSLLIRVVERRPRAVVLADRLYLASEDGLILKEAGPDEMPGLPIVRIEVGHPLKVGERIEASRLGHGVRLWQQFDRNTLGPGVRPREVRLEGDGSFTVSLGHGLPRLRFREEALGGQLDRLARVLQIRGISLHALEYADLRFLDKVIVKPLPKGGEA